MDLLLKLKKAFFLSSSIRSMIHVYALVENTGQETKLVLSASFL
jgi:tRNA pseudouridine-54 N-methylase